jgi:hypothetical protein
MKLDRIEAAPEDTPRDRLLAIVADVLGRAQDLDAAVPMLLRALAKDRPARDAMLQPFENVAARAALRHRMHMQRAAIWNGAGDGAERQARGGARESATDASPAASHARVHHLANAVAASLFDFPLPGGRRLAAATGAEVRAAAEVYRTRAADMGWKARWLDRIAASVPEDRAVGEVLTAEQVLTLREAAAHA